MTFEQFSDFWRKWSTQWYETKSITVNGAVIPVKQLCELKSDLDEILYNNYTIAKRIVKTLYFKDPEKKLSRYKRAAVIAYIIDLSSPLVYATQQSVDSFFLKQRLAFYVAIGSIIQDYRQKSVLENIAPGQTIYDFSSLDKDIECNEDSFLVSVYKDMFFSEVYQNYNILTMANIFGLITERCSLLPSIEKN